jgi:hypothetical protein
MLVRQMCTPARAVSVDLGQWRLFLSGGSQHQRLQLRALDPAGGAARNRQKHEQANRTRR